MRDFELIAGGKYLRRDGKTVQLSGPDSLGLLVDDLDGFSFEPDDLENGHMVFTFKESDEDLVKRLT